MGCGGSKTSDKDQKSPSKSGASGSKRSSTQRGKSAGKAIVKESNRKAVSKKHEDEKIEEIKARKPPKGVRRHSNLSRRTTSSDVQNPNFVPYDAENLPLDGNWEIEKGVDNETLMVDNSYPVPKYGKPVPEKINYSQVDFEIMKKNDMKQANGTFEDVATHLTKPFQPELMKVRALTTWMSVQKIRTRNYGADAKPDTVLGYMKRIKGQTGTYAGLLTNLCRAINIPCVIVKGIYKSYMHHIGEDDVKDSRSTWCAVYVDVSWQLVHPFLICTPLSSKSLTDGLKLLETSKVTENENTGSVLNGFFFAPKPSDFIHCCFPDQSFCYWQLLENHLKYQHFIELPYLRPAFFSNKMRLASEPKCTVTTQNGRGVAKIKGDVETASQTHLMYELYSCDTALEMDNEWGKLVMCARNEDTWIVQAKFPVEGVFKLALYGRICDWIFWLGDFRFVCDAPISPYVPWPQVPQDVGWGPTKLTERVGLLSPSHQGGIVFYKPNEEHVLKFLVNKKLRTNIEIEHPHYENEYLKRSTRIVQRKSELDFLVRLPLSGEFAVRIYLIDKNDESANVCNYLFTDWDDKPRENLFQRKARVQLREAAAAHDVEWLESSLTKFTSCRLLKDDDEYLRGERRLKYLKLKKGLRDGRMRLHEQTLAQAIGDAEQSQFKEALQPNINKANNVLDSLMSLQMHCHPVLDMDQKTIAEIANYSNPPSDVHQTMIATYLLLGEDKKSLQKWGYIQGLLRRQGREGIKYRVDQFRQSGSSMLDQSTVETVQKIHGSIPKEYILSASLSATTFYDWVSNVLSYISNYSKNAVDDDDLYGDHGNNNDDDNDDDLNKNDNRHTVDSLSQDEGFLDSQDMDSSVRTDPDHI